MDLFYRLDKKIRIHLFIPTYTYTDLNSRYDVFPRIILLLFLSHPQRVCPRMTINVLSLPSLFTRYHTETWSIVPGARRTRRGSNEPKEKGECFNPSRWCFQSPIRVKVADHPSDGWMILCDIRCRHRKGRDVSPANVSSRCVNFTVASLVRKYP